MMLKKNEKIFTVLFSAAVLIFFAAVFIINFCRNPAFYDADMYADMNLAKEMWAEKTIFPKNWVYGNQLSVVSTPVLTALFYGIFKDVIFALGLASSVMGVFIFLSFNWMLKPFTKLYLRLGGFVAMITLVTITGNMVSDIQGAQLFFTMASFYACYMITAFLVYGCYLRIINGKITVSLYILGAVSLALSFGTGIQSPRQTAIMTLPLVFCEIIRIIFDKVVAKKKIMSKVNLKVFIFVAAVFIFNIVGLVLVKYIPKEMNPIYGSFEIGSFSTMAHNFKVSCRNIFWLLYSRKIIVGPAVFFFTVVPAVIYIIKEIAKKKKYNPLMLLFILFALGVLSIMSIKVLTVNMEIREIYYFMCFPLTAVSFVIITECAKDTKNLIKIFSLVVFAAVFCIRIGQIFPEIKAGDSYKELKDFIIDNGYTSLYSEWSIGEKIDISSDDSLNVGFWAIFMDEEERPFRQIRYLCDPSVFENEGEDKTIYAEKKSIFEEKSIAEAEKFGVELTKLAEFKGKIYFEQNYIDEDIVLFEASKPICKVIREQEEN